jgi:hypothetical protein
MLQLSHTNWVIFMDDFQLSRADSRAICKEIGERLRSSMTATDRSSPKLRALMEEMARANGKGFVRATAG